MTGLSDRLKALEYISQLISKNGIGIQEAVQKTYIHNRWLTPENCEQSLQAIATDLLDKGNLKDWVDNYQMADPVAAKKIGLILAGNIPLVGFHDWLCVFISGHHARIKNSGKDSFLLPYIVDELVAAFPAFKGQTEFVERLNDMDAVIATGSNNSARYFEHYFGKYPHIIRKNRNGVAVLTGKESAEDFSNLGRDIFEFFGLGCRSTAKIFVPRDFDFPKLMEALHAFNAIVLNNKYKNNFDYQRTILLLNKVPHFINGSVICVEREGYASNIATLNYEFYDSIPSLIEKLKTDAELIQCVAAQVELPEIATIPFGQAQHPGLMDYADGVDTIAFLMEQ